MPMTFLGRLRRRRPDSGKNRAGDGVLVQATEHRCRPPFAHWSNILDEWVIDDDDRVRNGDRWVCGGCTTVWVEDGGAWKVETPCQ